MRTPVQGNDADVMDLLGFNGHVSRPLYDLQITVVDRRKQRWSHGGSSDATRLQRPVLYAVEFMSLFSSRPLSDSLSSLRRQGRDGSLGPHNQGCSPAPGNRRLKPVQPELGEVVMHIVRCIAGYACVVRFRLTLTLIVVFAQAVVLL